ncbi:MAG: UDP-2,3-diacylglucosamine diphosphatase [Gammaproteobacteria bacterium]|jgi:UDP-2,3-diacylglucosamine pyrophosphatase LpxH
MSKLNYRSIFISDVHLGTRDCHAAYLLDFLQSTDCEHLYLVGDIFDLWSMRKQVHWTAEQSAVVQCIFDKAAAGTEVTFIPGNHDALLRDFVGTTFRGVKVRRDAIHTAADGRRFLVSHGDEFDTVVKHNALLRFIGDNVYYWLLRLNRWYNGLGCRLGIRYWSLATWLKSRVGNARAYIRKFEEAAALTANDQELDGYICGHIHKASIEKINGALYCNDGDWVEHCTALVEDDAGWLQLLHWSDHQRVELITQGQEVAPAGIPPGSPALALLMQQYEIEVSSAKEAA